MYTRFTIGVLALASIAWVPPRGDDGQEEASYRLFHKAHKTWDFVLPAERWHVVDDSINLPGDVSFATKTSGVQKLEIDTNGDGKVDKDVRGQGGFVTLRAKDEDGELVKISIRLKNVAASKFNWATGSSMSGQVAGVMVHVFDQDGNGSYNDYGVDALAIGSEKSASLLSKVVPLKDGLHHFDISPDGREVKVKPYVGETGTLNAVAGFEAKGKLTSAVFQSGDMSFMVSGSRKGIEVPVGDYRFVGGKVAKGDASALIRSGRMKRVLVAPGQETRVDWGADVTGDFSFKQTDDKVTVKADFTFNGAAGEEYYDFQPRGKGPKIVISEADRGRKLKEGRFPES